MKQEITKEGLIKDFKALGLSAGDHIAISLSFKSLGPLNGGTETFIDALLHVVGPEGTIMVNTYTSNLRLSDIPFRKPAHIFDPHSSPSNTGIIPEKIRLRKNALRSRHPITSVAAIGKLAEYLTEDHDENAPAYMPYSRLAEAGGKILSIGLGDHLVGMRHQAQYLAGLLTIIPFRRGTLFHDVQGKIRLFRLEDHAGCVRRLPEMFPVLRKKGIVKDGRIGQAKSMLLPAKEALAVMTGLLKRDPTLNLCDDIFCLWCREIERCLHLYPKIRNPRYFQKHHAVITVISWINRMRLRDYRWVALLRHIAKTIFGNC